MSAKVLIYNSVMKHPILLFLLVIFLTASCKKESITQPNPVFSVKAYPPAAVKKTNSMQLFVHYMPWFENTTTSGTGKWGWHWTMNNQNPDITDANGIRQIASHYYPRIGPYASSDPALIEYHLLLMKYSGIDGVLIDWYGSTDYNDYGLNRRNTEALIALLDKVGMKFAIVYEDAIIPVVMQKGGSTDAISLARDDMYYLQTKYFLKSTYIKINGQPLLLVFGPSYFQKAADWEMIIGAFSSKPCFLPLWGASAKTGTASSGEFVWVDQVNIDSKYPSKDKFPVFFGGAWPGFHDFYKEGGSGNNLFTIDYNNGTTWDTLLKKASSNNMNYLQLITWNDFGEGTMIEPTNEFGYSYLERLQQFAGINYSKTDLEAIAKQFSLRKSKGMDSKAAKVLDQSFYYWVSLQNNKAMHLIDSLSVAK
jgi:hypothetical protein